MPSSSQSAAVAALVALLHVVGANVVIPTLPCSFKISTVANVQTSMQKLQGLLAGHNGRGDFIVCLEPGVHKLGGSPMALNTSFNRRDGGHVVWQSMDPEVPATLDGGVQLSYWSRCGEGSPCPDTAWHGVWFHNIADVKPAMDHSMLPVRQLWVKGQRIDRTIFDLQDLGFAANDQGFSTPNPTEWFADWVQNQVEFRWTKTIDQWIEPRCVVTGVSWAPVGSQIIVEPECWQNLIRRNQGKWPPAPTFADNVHQPPRFGEFHSTPQYVFYRPPKGHTSQLPTDAWVPVQEELLTADGIANHEFRNIQFRHATWRQPGKPSGYVSEQTAVRKPAGQVEPTGAVDIKHSHNIAFDKCQFVDLGAIYALAIHHRSQHVQVTRCRFEGCSGGAIKLGNVDDDRAISTDPSDFDESFLVQENTIEDIAIEFRDAAAVFAGYVRHTVIAQNTIKNTRYTGISLGWGWGHHVEGPQTFAANNHIRKNKLIGVMTALNDGGCIYTLGPQPDSTIEGNYCQMNAAPWTGFFYFDNGSRFFKVWNNVADSGQGPCINLQGCCDQPARDVAVSKLWCRSTSPSRNGCAEYGCTIDMPTHHVLSDSGTWPAEALKVIDGAGASPAMEHPPKAPVHFI